MPDFLIYDLLPDESPALHNAPDKLPLDVDFKTGLKTKLFPEWKMVKGAPEEVIYYKNCQPLGLGNYSYSDPIVKIMFSFDRDGLGLAIQKIRRIYWFTDAGTWSEEFKEMTEVFTNSEAIAEAEKRRKNIIDALKVETIGLIMLTMGVDQKTAAGLGTLFLSEFKVNIIDYIDESNPSFLSAISSADAVKYPWLENLVPKTPYSIRQYMASKIQ